MNRLLGSDPESHSFSPQTVDRLLEKYRANGDDAELQIALGLLGARLLKEREYARNEQIARERLEVVRRLHDPFELAGQLIRSGFTLLFAGQFADARRHINEGLALSHRIGNQNGIAHAALLLAGDAMTVAGEYEAAKAHLLTAIGISRDLRLPILVPAMAMDALCTLVDGEISQAEAKSTAVLQEAERSGIMYDRGRYCRGIIQAFKGDYEDAADDLGQVLQLTTNPSVLHAVHFALGLVAHGRGDQRQTAVEFVQGGRPISNG